MPILLPQTQSNARPKTRRFQRLAGWVIPLLFVLVAIFVSDVAHAEGEELDPTFGNGGVISIASPNTNAQSHEVVALWQYQNVIVAAVNLTNTNNNTAAGAMLTLLGTDGKPLDPPTALVTNDLSVRYTAIVTTAVDEILVVGIIQGSTTPTDQKRDFFVQRFRINPQGNPRLTALSAAGVFGVFDGSDDVATFATRMSDGKIFIAGYSNFDDADHFSGVRLNANGTIDTDFGLDGRLNDSTNLGRAYSVAVNNSGVIALGGSTGSGSAERPRLNFYDTAGNPTVGSSFLNEGRINALSIVVDVNDVQVLLVGSTERNPTTVPQSFDATYRYYTFANTLYDVGNPVQRLVRSATDETLFGSAGLGALVVLAGTIHGIAPETDSNFFFTLLSNLGAFANPAYGVGGVTTVDVSPRIGGNGGAPDFMKSGFIQPDGGILLGGFAKPQGPNSAPVGVIVRLARKAIITKSVDKTQAKVDDTLTYRLEITATANATIRLTDTIPIANPVHLTDIISTTSAGMVITQVATTPLAWDVRLPSTRGTILLTGTVAASSAITPTAGVTLTNVVSYALPGSAIASSSAATVIARDFLTLTLTPPFRVAEIGETVGYRVEITKSRGMTLLLAVSLPEYFGGQPEGPVRLKIEEFTPEVGVVIEPLTITLPSPFEQDFLYAAIGIPSNYGSLWFTGTVISTAPISTSGGLNVPINALYISDIYYYGGAFTSTANILAPQSVISVTKTADKEEVKVGDTINYSLVMTGSPGVSFRMTETIPIAGPASLTGIAVTQSPGLVVNTVGANPLVWQVTLPLSRSGVMTVTGTIAATGPITQEKGFPMTNTVQYAFEGAPPATDSVTVRLVSSLQRMRLPALFAVKEEE